MSLKDKKSDLPIIEKGLFLFAPFLFLIKFLIFNQLEEESIPLKSRKYSSVSDSVFEELSNIF